MSMWLRQSTTVNIKLGPAVSQSDAVTEKTALSPTVNLTKGAGTIAARHSATAIAHDANGWYTVELDATDTGTLGRLQVYFRDPTNQLPVWESYMVVPAVVYDAMIAGSDNLDVSLVQWLGTAPNALQSGRVDSYLGAVASGVIAAGSFAANALDAVWSTTTRTLSAFAFSVTVGTNNDKTGYGLSAAAVQAIWDAATSALTTVGSIGKRLVDYLTGDIYARLGAPAGASVSADVAAIKTDTGNLVTRITSTLFSGITSLAQWLGLLAGKQVGNSTARTELRATGAGSGTYDETTDSQEALRDNVALDSTVAKDATVAKDSTVAKEATVAALNNLSAAQVLTQIQNALDTAVPGTPTANSINERIKTLDDAFTAARAAYLDNLSGGAVALNATVAKEATVAALNNLASSDVLAQVNAALDAAIAELTGVPSATPSLRTGLMLLYMNLRNRTDTTATAETIKNSAGTTIATAALSDDGTTFSKAKFA